MAARKPPTMLWLCELTILLLFMISFLKQPVSVSCETESTESAISYSEYCSKIVPESKPSFSSRASTSFSTLRQSEYGAYYSGGENRILNSNITRFVNSFLFRTRLVYKTDRDGVFKIESRLALQSPGNMPGRSPNLYLKLQGFWSESSGNLCMVGEGSAYSKQGRQLTPAAVLKLTNLKNSCNITTLITGTLVSLSSNTAENYFEPVSLLIIPQLKYNYTVVSDQEFENGFSRESGKRPFCSLISESGTFFNLQYSSGCSPGKNCFPFDGKNGYLPSSMSLRRSEYCSEIKRRLRLMIEFHNVSHVGFYRSFNPNSILIGEGFWDDKNNLLSVLACRFLDIAESWSNASLGNCTTRLTLRFPGIISMRETSSIMGQILSNKTVNDSGYFYPIVLQSTENHLELASGFKYEYTEMERVKQSCPRKKPAMRREEISYASAYNSIDMEFDISVKTSEGKTGWGSAVPISVGDRLYDRYLNPVVVPSSSMPVIRTELLDGPVNISYEIGIRIRPAPKVDGKAVLFYNLSSEGEKMKITAEGIYDPKTGSLCMVGCRKIGSTNDQISLNASLDCKILLNFQFPSIKPDKNGGGFVKGSIESTREKSDPLYFNPLHLSSAAYVVEQAKQSLWTMDLETTMILISNTLVCVFVGLQLFHVKRNPELLSFISLVMLVILTLSYMIPLVLNFEALFSKKQDQHTILAHSAEWLEVNEVTVRIITMLAFLLQFRLLQLALWAKSENQMGQWVAEKMTLLVTVSMYVSGAFIAIVVNWGKNVMLIPSYLAGYQQNSTWEDLKSYAGLISDGFLLPQILLNIFANSKENSLSCSFYVGTTFIRLLPHLFDLYTNHVYFQQKGIYIFVNPSEDFFSIAWDVCIALGLLLFTAIIFLQQRFGGRCILPARFKEFKAYEKIPVTGES